MGLTTAVGNNICCGLGLHVSISHLLARARAHTHTQVRGHVTMTWKVDHSIKLPFCLSVPALRSGQVTHTQHTHTHTQRLSVGAGAEIGAGAPCARGTAGGEREGRGREGGWEGMRWVAWMFRVTVCVVCARAERGRMRCVCLCLCVSVCVCERDGVCMCVCMRCVVCICV